MTPSAILVTGAGGFIGGAVARTLAALPGMRVHAATRDGRDLGGGLRPCRLDVRDPAALADCLRGIDAVVHCAVGGRATTVAGTGLLLRAASDAGVRRVVHLSSVAVYGARAGVVDEAAPLISPTGGGYAHWKAAAEALCRDAAASGCQPVVLRPAIVYGPGSREFLVRPAARLLSGAWGALGALGAGTCNLVHVRDVAGACAAALLAPASACGEAFNIAGPERLTWDGFYARLASGLGLPPPRPVPAQAWRRRMLAGLPFKALARLVPASETLFARRILAAPAGSELTLFGLAATYPLHKAEARLGWQPRIGLEEGLAGSVAWLREAGLA